MPADVNGEHDNERRERLASVGLHFCRRYRNVVRYNPEFCGKCPFNGLRPSPSDPDGSETCF